VNTPPEVCYHDVSAIKLFQYSIYQTVIVCGHLYCNTNIATDNVYFGFLGTLKFIERSIMSCYRYEYALALFPYFFSAPVACTPNVCDRKGTLQFGA
jgi:hypothetical protein